MFKVSRIGTCVKSLVAALAATAAISFAAPANALQLLSATMDTSNTANISGPGLNENAYIGPITFTATDGGPAFNFLAYCVDLYHNMFLGPLNGGAGYAYHEEDLLTDSKTNTPVMQNGTALTQAQINKISSLVNFGAYLQETGASDLSHKLAGVQGAIWKVENPLFTITASGAVQGYITAYAAGAAGPGMPVGMMHTIFANDFGHQAFAFAGGVPEPATWLMMIMGFGGIGAALRRRRAGAVFA